jgi:hypothetical protein
MEVSTALKHSMSTNLEWCGPAIRRTKALVSFED